MKKFLFGVYVGIGICVSAEVVAQEREEGHDHSSLKKTGFILGGAVAWAPMAIASVIEAKIQKRRRK